MSEPNLRWVEALVRSPWSLLLFLPFWGVMWPLVTTLVSWICGHRALLERYPPLDEPREESFGWASGYVRGVRFNHALYVGLGQRGLHLAPKGVFRSPFHRGVPCIPWEELRCIRAPASGLQGLLRAPRFEVPSLGLRFTLDGAAGRALAQRLGFT